MSATPTLSERFVARDKSALARSITWAENGDARFAELLAGLWSRVGRAWRIGITGPPGVGKSTLTNELAKLEREAGAGVGILAVDPSSPFTGGALLGDRIRMEERTLDPGVFIRSMASRASHGGLARAAIDALDAMDAFGFETLIVETVGVGQAEYDVVRAADTVVVVLGPGAGDGVQAMKAGLLEVADVLAVNKKDLPGAERLVRDLEESVHVRMRPRSAWQVPVVACSAAKAEGLAELRAAIGAHRGFVEQSGLAAARRARRVEQIRGAVAERLAETLWDELGYGAWLERSYEGREAPQRTTERLLATILEHVPPAAGSASPAPRERGPAAQAGDA